MRLLAISDLHIGHRTNRLALQQVPACDDDWLIIAGDVAERDEDLAYALEVLSARFAKLIWTPGNHELWCAPTTGAGATGPHRYQRLVALCRSHGVVTPEDPFPLWPGRAHVTIAPVFTHYDYTFRPDDIAAEDAVNWAAAAGIRCADEDLLSFAPFTSRAAWCATQCASVERRLAVVPSHHDIILVNHYPLRRDLVRLPGLARFSIWSGTRLTEEWPNRFRIRVAISGHLHYRATDFRRGVRYEEVSLGYPHQWDPRRGAFAYFREILTG